MSLRMTKRLLPSSVRLVHGCDPVPAGHFRSFEEPRRWSPPTPLLITCGLRAGETGRIAVPEVERACEPKRTAAIRSGVQPYERLTICCFPGWGVPPLPSRAGQVSGAAAFRPAVPLSRACPLVRACGTSRAPLPLRGT